VLGSPAFEVDASVIDVRALTAPMAGRSLAAQPIERAVVLGPVKAKPFGWPRRAASLRGIG